MSPNASAVARGVLIVHLILSPLVFSGATLEAFESNKVALLATTALALVAISGLSLRPGIGRSAISWLREPVTLSVLALLISAIVSTGLSITPTTSFFGAPESCSGFTTAAAYAITFLATRYFCRTAN